MARSYSAREGGSLGASWRFSSAIDDEIAIAKADMDKLNKDLREAQTWGLGKMGRSFTRALNVTKTNLAFFEGVKEMLSKAEDVKNGNVSVFEPPLTKASPYHAVQGQLALYEIAKKNGVETGKRFNENDLDEIWEKYGEDRKRETFVWWDSENRRVAGVTGRSGEVETPIMTKHSDIKPVVGGTTWHNHPVVDGRFWGFPPSRSDISSMFQRYEKTAYVASKEGTYRVSLSKETLDGLVAADPQTVKERAERVSKKWNEVWDAAIVAVRRLYNFSDQVFKDSEQATNLLNTVNEVLAGEAKKLGLEYSFTPRKQYADKLQKV